MRSRTRAWAFAGLVAVACVVPSTEVLPRAAAPGRARVLDTIEVGRHPHGISFSADGREARVALTGDGAVAVIDVATREVEMPTP